MPTSFRETPFLQIVYHLGWGESTGQSPHCSSIPICNWVGWLFVGRVLKMCIEDIWVWLDIGTSNWSFLLLVAGWWATGHWLRWRWFWLMTATSPFANAGLGSHSRVMHSLWVEHSTDPFRSNSLNTKAGLNACP